MTAGQTRLVRLHALRLLLTRPPLLILQEASSSYEEVQKELVEQVWGEFIFLAWGGR